MKIILLESLSPEPHAIFLPDSALLRPGNPLFYPESGFDWTLRPMLAVRLNRLGKGVAPQFAARYYDSVAPALMLHRPGGFPSPLQNGTDGSLVTGTYVPTSDFPDRISLSAPGYQIDLYPNPDIIAKAIASISSYVIIKMGDIILISPELLPGGTHVADIPISPRTRLAIPPYFDLKIV